MTKVLIANRGEIACRIIRTARALGHGTVAVYSSADAQSPHVTMADEAVEIGPAKAKESYLNIGSLLSAVRETGAAAVHPGYGLLSENASFARAVEESGALWIGPAPQTVEDMGDKEKARWLAVAAGVPVVPASDRFAVGNLEGVDAAAKDVGYPLLVKAAAGGGGIGMRRVDAPEGLRETIESTQAMAERSFGDGSVFLERLVAPARHIEVQVFGFGDGDAVHVFERECSLQRRYQKIVEETPAPRLSEATRQRMAEAALALTRQERYRGAGTVEFIVDQDESFYFLEMNTRLQVEHPVTEMVTGLDLVALQIRLAFGEPVKSELIQDSIRRTGHAIECRLYAEQPGKQFLPSPGTLTRFAPPKTDAKLRIDAGVAEGGVVTIHYDPMIAKVIAHGNDRGEAIARLGEALESFEIGGIATNRDFLVKLLRHPAFRDGAVDTDFVTRTLPELI